LIAAVLGYGHWRLNAEQPAPGPSIALIQGSIDTSVKSDPGEAETIFREYFELSQTACRAGTQLDLVVWPETMFRAPYLTYEDNAYAPPGEDWKLADLQAAAERNRSAMGDLAGALEVPILLGVDSIHFGPATCDRFNSALLVRPDGHLGPRYDKTHPVPFGEYVPLAKALPWIYRLTPLAGGIECGTSTPSFPAGKARVAANICYESALSHVIREQITAQRQRGEEPDVLVNLTNDGWFHGSSELDMHLYCAVFRAIECRKPFLIAANTGFSAWIDASGRIIKQAKRHQTDWIVAQVELDNVAVPTWPTAIGRPACVCWHA
jgi:apolipoprotein N-acyltransferase